MNFETGKAMYGKTFEECRSGHIAHILANITFFLNV